MNQIIEFENELKYEGNFYPYEDEKGNGIIIKINKNSELIGEEYRICVKECKCIVECETNNDCGNGMNCVENKCMGNGMKKRKENDVNKVMVVMEGERKIAQIVMAIPISVCVYGVFTSMFLAKEYGDKYYSEKCDNECPSSANNVQFETEIDVQDNRKRVFHCKGSCSINEELFQATLRNRMLKRGEDLLSKGWDGNEMLKTLGDEETMLFLAKKNHKLMKIACESKKLDQEIIADAILEAVSIFVASGQKECDTIEHKWKFSFFDEGESFFSEIHDIGIFDKICEVNTVINCS